MADNDKPLPLRDPHNVRVEFVNQVVGAGFLNGNINITFAAAQFTPNPEGKIDPDLVIASRLRMDLFCAVQLRDQLTRLIDQNLHDIAKSEVAH